LCRPCSASNSSGRRWRAADRLGYGALAGQPAEDLPWPLGVDLAQLSGLLDRRADQRAGRRRVSLVELVMDGLVGPDGDLCHTSAWPEGLDMAGKSVGVVGTGSSAVQVIHEAVKVASQVKIFQLEPNWIIPKGSRDFTPLERKLNKIPVIYKWRRLRLYLDYDFRQYRSSHARTTGRANRRRKQAAIKFMHEPLASRPELLEYTTPSFPFEARRTVITDSYYTALLDPKVTLVPHGIKELTAAGTVDANGDEHGWT
jgi:cation diffusion facilitator CzcD-associated flavoprotein CzcO